jgi:hypothetical protein
MKGLIDYCELTLRKEAKGTWSLSVKGPFAVAAVTGLAIVYILWK